MYGSGIPRLTGRRLRCARFVASVSVATVNRVELLLQAEQAFDIGPDFSCSGAKCFALVSRAQYNPLREFNNVQIIKRFPVLPGSGFTVVLKTDIPIVRETRAAVRGIAKTFDCC